MIYFARLASGAIKIGTTEDLRSRVVGLRNHYGCNVEILATMPGGRDEEQAIHRRFASCRLGKTEQFRPRGDILDFIGVPNLGFPDPDSVVEQEPVTKPMVLGMRGSDEWKQWIDEFADHCRLSVSGLIDRVLEESAVKRGFQRPPKR